MNRRKTGAEYEEKALVYLESLGMRLRERNYRTRYGEIDLILQDGPALVFVEVKYRATAKSGYALEAVTGRKQQKILRIARQYLYSHHIAETTPVRFDCVGYTGEELRYVKNAF